MYFRIRVAGTLRHRMVDVIERMHALAGDELFLK